MNLDEPLQRWDLRLAGPAVGGWVGCAAGLIGDAWLLPIGTVAVAGVATTFWRTRWGCGVLVTAVAAITLAILAGLTVRAAGADPLVQAADRGAWGSLMVTVSGIPSVVPGGPGFGPAAGGGKPPLRWRVTTSPDDAVVGGRQWDPVSEVTVFSDDPAWGQLLPGSRVRVAGLLQPDLLSAVPAVVLGARSPPQLRVPAPWWQRLGGAIRHRLAGTAAVLPEDEAGLLRGIAVGDTAAVPGALDADARTTGLTHLLAVSGSHFAIICGVVVLLLRRVGRRLAAVGGLLTLCSLVVLVGPQPSVRRAAAMGTIVLVAVLLRRPAAAIPGLCVAVLVLLGADPSLAVSPGFALSVLATAGLAVLAPSWAQALRRRGWPPGAADALSVPAAATVVTAPVVASLSGRLSLVALPANLLVAPVVAVSLVIGVLCAIIGAGWPHGGIILARVDGPLLGWVAGVAHRLARWPSATVAWPASVPGVTMLVGLLLAGLLVLRGRRVRAAVLAALAGTAAVLVPTELVPMTAPGWPPQNWLLVGCEVGQGDGMVLSTGEPGVGVVVDAGPDPALIDACLDRLGVTTVPLMVMTHLHADHVNGVPGVLPGRSLGAIGVGPDRSSLAAWRLLTTVAASRSAPVLELRPGTHWASGELSLQVLGPAAEFHGTDSDPNNDSVVLMATRRGTRILMTGDIEVQAQQRLLDAGVPLRADLMEQPHHGSAKFLPAFAAAVAPRVTVIGVGRGNDYGMPNQATLRILAAAGITVLRTDEQGDVAVSLLDGALATTVRGPSLPAPKGRLMRSH